MEPAANRNHERNTAADPRRAILYPLFGGGLAPYVTVLLTILLPICAFLIPAHSSPEFSDFATVDALAMAAHSPFPAAVAICYTSAVYGGIFSGLLFGFSNSDLTSAFAAFRGLSRFKKIAGTFSYLLFVRLFICHELPFSQADDGFFYLAANQRLFLSWWVVGVFVAFTVGTIFFLISLKELQGKLDG